MPPRSVPEPPTADLPPADRLEPFTAKIETQGHYDYLHARDVVWDESTDAEHARISQCLFTNVALDGGTWSRANLSDVRFTDSRLVATDLARSHWRDTEFRDVLIAGAQWHGTDVRRTHFERTKFDAVNFRDASLTDVVFTDCLLREADFSGAKLTRVRFPGCVFERADFARAKLAEVDLRGARLEFARGLDALRGATIDSGQLIDLAPAFAAHFGISVSDS